MGSQSQSHHSHIKHLASLNSSPNFPCILVTFFFFFFWGLTHTHYSIFSLSHNHLHSLSLHPSHCLFFSLPNLEKLSSLPLPLPLFDFSYYLSPFLRAHYCNSIYIYICVCVCVCVCVVCNINFIYKGSINVSIIGNF